MFQATTVTRGVQEQGHRRTTSSNVIVRMNPRLLAATAYLLIFCVLAPAAAPRPERKTADGVELPAVLADRRFHSAVPLAGPVLGQRPEDVGRVFSTKKSQPLLARHGAPELGCDWFILNLAGSDVAGLGLMDGRVNKVVLYYEAAPPLKIARLRKQIEANADHLVKATLKQLGNDKKPSMTITFEVDAIEFYLNSHDTDPAIAQAMHSTSGLNP